MNKIIKCNGCGRMLPQKNGIVQEDFFEGKKQWGYFSKRDGEIDSFILCESCYEKMTEQFAVPPHIQAVTEY